MPRISIASALGDPKHEQLVIPAKDKRKAFGQNAGGSMQPSTITSSHSAIQYRKEAYKIRKNLTKLVQEVNLIQQNKFVDSNKKSNADTTNEAQHPT